MSLTIAVLADRPDLAEAMWDMPAFDKTGPVLVPRALAPVHCDVEHGVAAYVEPNVWVVHRTGGTVAP